MGFLGIAVVIGVVAASSTKTAPPPSPPEKDFFQLALEETGTGTVGGELRQIRSSGPENPPARLATSPRTPQEIARTAFASTVLLMMDDANGRPLSLGSGFFVRKGEIVSNLHVVAGAAGGSAKLVGLKVKYDIEGVTAVDPERDLVLLRVSAPGSPGLPIGDSEAVQVGETVYAVGNPRGLEGTFSQGVVSAVRDAGGDKLLQITAPISPGSSGGPVLNGRGEVVGVAVATVRGGQNLNLAIPSGYLKALLAGAGPAEPLTRAKPARAPRSISSDFGVRSTEGVVGGQFAWDGYYGSYSFSLRNELRHPVKNVYCLVVFRNAEGEVVDVDRVRFGGVVPGGLAKRVTGRVDESVRVIVTFRPRTPVEFRVLDFEIVE